MDVVKGANLALRFLLELCALAALGYWGYRSGGSTAARWALAIGLPLAAAVLWAVFVSPNRNVDVLALRVLLEVAILGGAAAALVATGHPRLAVVFAAVAVANRILMAVWDQQHRVLTPAKTPS